MKFGLFGSAQAKRGGPDLDSGQGFRDYIEYNVEAEALGYASTFAVEHHFTGFGQVSATLSLLTWVAARTKTLRLGTAVMVLPWHNPVLLAEQAATLDLLSGGRLDFGIGKGYRHNEFAGFCIPMEEADERFEEGLAVVLKAWTSEERFCTMASTGTSRISSSSRRPIRNRIRRSGWARQRCLDRQGRGARLQAVARSVRTDGHGDRALQPLQGRGREARPQVRPERRRALARRICVEERGRQDAGDRDAGGEPAADGRSCADAGQVQQGDAVELRRHRRGERRRGVVWLAGRDRAQARSPAQGGFEQILLSGPAGSRENLRAFARDVMPAFSGSASERAPSRARPALVTP